MGLMYWTVPNFKAPQAQCKMAITLFFHLGPMQFVFNKNPQTANIYIYIYINISNPNGLD